MAAFDGANLRIEGTNGNDQIIVRQINNQISIDNASIRWGNTNVQSISASAVKGITVDSLAGNDLILLNSGDFAGQQAITASATVHGGAGNDQIAGTAANDFLYGDDGNDGLWGCNGDDYLSGGNGDDGRNGQAPIKGVGLPMPAPRAPAAPSSHRQSRPG